MPNGNTPSTIIPGTAGSGTGFIQTIFTVSGTIIVLIAGWLFTNIFAELQHQRQRQETLFREVTALQGEAAASKARLKGVEDELKRMRAEALSRVFAMERDVQDIKTRNEIYQQQISREVHIRSMPPGTQMAPAPTSVPTPGAQFSPR